MPGMLVPRKRGPTRADAPASKEAAMTAVHPGTDTTEPISWAEWQALAACSRLFDHLGWVTGHAG